MLVTSDTPKDLKTVAEIARELGLAEATIRNWQARGFVRRWQLAGRRGLSSVEEVRRFATEPRPEPPKDE